MEDKRIIQLLWARAEGAIDAMAEKFGRRLMATARNILGDRRDAEEAVSDTYLAVWNAVPPQKPDPLAGYVYRTGRNLALKKLRAAAAQKRDGRYDLSLEELAPCLSGVSLEEEFDRRALGQAIDRFLDTLPRDKRVLFLRRYWFGDSVQDLARHFDISENAVSLRLSRIRGRLKDYLIQEGFLYDAEAG